MYRIISPIFIMFIFAGMSWAAEKPVINGFDDEVSYSVGHQIGRDMVRQQVNVNPELLLKGIMDATGNVEPLMKFEKMLDTMVALKEKIVAQANDHRTNALAMGAKFLAENAKKPGVVTRESGLQYKVITPGKGQSPQLSDTVEVSYNSADIYGKTFGTTYKNGKSTPVQFKVTDVIPGWMEALQLMKEGSKWEIYVPSQLAFKDTTPLAGQSLVFEIELHKILK